MHAVRLVAALALVACAADGDKAAGQWTPGKGDGDRAAIATGAIVGEDDDSGDGRDAKLDCRARERLRSA